MLFDLHVHSNQSNDSILSPAFIIKKAKKERLHGVAITDHETIKGGLITRSLSKDELFIICGAEIRTNYGDVIGLFLNEEIKSILFEDVIDEIKSQDGIAVLPHPYRNSLKLTDKLLKQVDLIEGLNGRDSKYLNNKAQLIAKKLDKTIIAGSDAHIPHEIGRVSTVIEGIPELCCDEYLKKLFMSENICISGSESSFFSRKASILLGRIVRKSNKLWSTKPIYKKEL